MPFRISTYTPPSVVALSSRLYILIVLSGMSHIFCLIYLYYVMVIFT